MKSRGTDRQADGKTILFLHAHPFTRFIYTFHTDTYACPGSGKYLGSPCTVCSDQWGCPCGTPEWGCDGSCRTSSAVARCSCRTAPRRKDCSRSLPVSPGFEKCGRSRYSCCRKEEPTSLIITNNHKVRPRCLKPRNCSHENWGQSEATKNWDQGKSIHGRKSRNLRSG